MQPLSRSAQYFVLAMFTGYLLACGGGGSSPSSTPVAPQAPPPAPASYSGVLQWKADSSTTGTYSSETKLTTANVNSTQFGRYESFTADGIVMAQPLYVRGLDMGSLGTHDLVIIATENDSVYALDADNFDGGTLWERHYLDAANGITFLPDNFGGRTTLGGEVGITGTPVIDGTTGVMYFVTTLSDNGVAQQWLRAIDIHTGNDYAPSVQIAATVPGDGKASVNGQISFDPSIQNQRPGLTEVNGEILVGWGSFSDWGVYHGWLMAFDPKSLALVAVFNPTTQAQAVDAANGPADHGGGGAFWQGGAAPAVDSDGNIFINTADGSFNANLGGNNYGDSMLKLTLTENAFKVVDYFTPSDANCIDLDDLEMGSSGVALLPTDFTNGAKLAVTHNKEGRLFVINRDSLGQYNSTGDLQIPGEFMVGDYSCDSSTTGGAAEGPGWDRLYGTASYWNGNVYAGASNLPLKQYQFQNGVLGSAPVATSPTSYGYRGANTVVSANGTKNGIVWAYEKTAAGQGILHAYDANSVLVELWNSNMNSARDSLGEGIGFSTPVIADGRVITTYNDQVGVFGVLQ